MKHHVLDSVFQTSLNKNLIYFNHSVSTVFYLFYIQSYQFSTLTKFIFLLIHLFYLAIFLGI